MEVYTSYFSSKALEKGDYTLVSIARSVPSGFLVDYTMEYAKPSKELLTGYKNGTITWEQYTNIYNEDTTPNIWILFMQLKGLWDTYHTPIVLLCWEGKGKPCHRHLLAALLREYCQLEIKEL